MIKSKFIVLLAVGMFLVAGCGQNTLDPKAVAQGGPAGLNKIAGQKGSDPNIGGTFRFVVMADRTNTPELGRWAQAVEEVNLLKPDLVMSVGDYTNGYKEDADRLVQEWKDFDAENTLKAPFFFTPGNHDVLGVATRKTYSRLHNVDGAPYYSFNYRGCHFVVIDTTCLVENKDEGALAAAQWKWLEQDLSSLAARNSQQVFVFMHFPLWDTNETKKVPGDQWKKLRAMVDPAKTTMFAGHTHELKFMTVDGVPCHTLAVTAAKSAGDLSRGQYQMFAFVTVDAGKPTVAYIPVGQVMPQNAMDIFAQRTINSILDQATFTAVSEKGGSSFLTLPNSTRNEMTFELKWSGTSDRLKALQLASESLKVPAGQTATRTYELPAISGGESLTLTIGCTYMFNSVTYSAGRDFPLTVVKEFEALSGEAPDVNKPLSGGNQLGNAGADGSLLWQMTYDDRNLYVVTEVTDDKIVTESKQAYDRDGVQIFIDPRPAEKQAGPFAGSICRQLMIPVPAEGQPLQVFSNPDNKAITGSVSCQWKRTEGGYRIATKIPVPLLAFQNKLQAGTVLRMDLYVTDRDDPSSRASPKNLAVSGKLESSRQTVHYARIILK